MAEMNTNLFKGGGLVSPSTQAQVTIDKDAVGRTLRNIAAPVFDFFTKEAEPQETTNVDYEREIQKYEMRAAITQKILNDSDPKARKRMDIVI